MGVDGNVQGGRNHRFRLAATGFEFYSLTALIFPLQQFVGYLNPQLPDSIESDWNRFPLFNGTSEVPSL